MALTGLAGLLAVATLAGSSARATVVPDTPLAGKSGLLSRCTSLPDQKEVQCYVDGFLAMIDKSGNPATELPRIDTLVHEEGGFIEAACHPIMHIVGREWARQHHINFISLMHYIPRSNDPGCSAGFGMGLVIYLGPDLVLHPRQVLGACTGQPTRFREYTCIHGSGHALMRGFHGDLHDAIKACRTLGPTNAPDCAQGAFMDYWTSLAGGDGTTRPTDPIASPRVLCAGYEFVRPCWYRFYWETQPNDFMYAAADLTRTCKGLADLQRAGCMAGASLAMARAREPVDHARTCEELEGRDVIECLRGVAVPGVMGKPFEQMRLIRTCGTLSKMTRSRCFNWFGRTLAVITNGRFGRSGCSQLANVHEQVWCRAGAAHLGRPLRTFA